MEFDLLRSIQNSTSPEKATLSRVPLILGDVAILQFQYFGQVAIMAASVCHARLLVWLLMRKSYGIEIEEDDQDVLDMLLTLKSSYIANDTLRLHQEEIAGEYLLDLIQDPLNRALSGVLWFPTAVSTLSSLQMC